MERQVPLRGCRARVTVENALFNLMSGWIEAARFGADVHRVVTVRMMQFASGDVNSATEVSRMISEKAAAFGEAQLAMMAALANGDSLPMAAARVYAPYRRRVRANVRRLGG